MDATTENVKNMYSRFPYPSPSAGRQDHKELANLLRLFCHETGIDLSGRRILDAGTGSGHRLIEAAALFPDTQFLGVDISDAALEVAASTARDAGIENVSFEAANLMEDLGQADYDLVLSMGVLHHTSSPEQVLRNLVNALADDGFLFLYVYGHWGAQERMRRKAIVSLLQGGGSGDFDQGIKLVRDLGFGLEEYGWKVDPSDEATYDALLVDSYLNVNDKLFDLDQLTELFRGSGLDGYVPYGITTDNAGVLFDVYPGKTPRMLTQMTDFKDVRTGAAASTAFDTLSLEQRYRLTDLVYRPNGYTLLGFREASAARLEAAGRLLSNACRFG